MIATVQLKRYTYSVAILPKKLRGWRWFSKNGNMSLSCWVLLFGRTSNKADNRCHRN